MTTDILAVEREIIRLQREIDKPESVLPDEELEVLIDQQIELDRKILTAPASTVREVDAKLRRLIVWIGNDSTGFLAELPKAVYEAVEV